MDLFKQLYCVLIVILSVSCATQNISGSNKNPKEVIVNMDYQIKPITHIGVFESKIEGNILMIRFGNRKSCGKEDNYRLITNLQVNKSSPPQLRMSLENIHESDNCNQDSTQTYFFDLGPLKNHYKSGKVVSDNVVLNLNGRNCGLFELD